MSKSLMPMIFIKMKLAESGAKTECFSLHIAACQSQCRGFLSIYITVNHTKVLTYEHSNSGSLKERVSRFKTVDTIFLM